MSVAHYGGKIIIPENGSPIKVEPAKDKSKLVLNSPQEEKEEEEEEEGEVIEEEEEEEEEEFLCPICQGGEEETDSYAKLADCQHVFCEPCITEWSKNANTCPICRNRFDHLCTCPTLRGDFSAKVKIDYKCPNKDTEVAIDHYICQICNSGEQEELLLLCDGCDEAYHTHCLSPALRTIPDGDWFCVQCSGGDEEEEESGLDITPSGGSIQFRLPSTTRRLAMEELLRRTRRTSERRQSRGERRRYSAIAQAAQLISSITGRARTAKGAKLARIATRTVGLHTLRGLKRKKSKRSRKQRRSQNVPDWSPPIRDSPERLQVWAERDKIEGDIAGFSKAALAAHKAHKAESLLGARHYLSEPGPSAPAEPGPAKETPVNLIDMITADIINSSSKTPTVDKKGDVVYKTREEVFEELLSGNTPQVKEPEESPRKTKVQIKSPRPCRSSSHSTETKEVASSKWENPHQPIFEVSARDKKSPNESKRRSSHSTETKELSRSTSKWENPHQPIFEVSARDKKSPNEAKRRPSYSTETKELSGSTSKSQNPHQPIFEVSARDKKSPNESKRRPSYSTEIKELSGSTSKSENPHQSNSEVSRDKKSSNESKSGGSRSYSSSPRRGKQIMESKEKSAIPSKENEKKPAGKVTEKSKRRSSSNSSSDRRKDKKHKKHRRSSDHKKAETAKKKKKSRRRSESSDSDSSEEEKDKTRGRKHRQCSKSDDIKAEEKRSKSKKYKKEKSLRDDSEEFERQKSSKKSSKDQKKKKKGRDKSVEESRSKKRRDSKKPRRKTRSRSNSLEIMENLRDKYSDRPTSSEQNSPTKSDRSSSRKLRQSSRPSPERWKREPRRREPEIVNRRKPVQLDDLGRDVNLRKITKKQPPGPVKSSNQDRSFVQKLIQNLIVPTIHDSYNTGPLGSLDDVYSPGDESPIDDVWPTKNKPQSHDIYVPSLDEIKLPEITDIVQKLAIPGFSNTMTAVGEPEMADSDDMVIDSEEDPVNKPNTKYQAENKTTESSSSSSPLVGTVSDLFIKMAQAEKMNVNKTPSPQTPEFLAGAISPAPAPTSPASPSASTPEYLMTPPRVQAERRRERIKRQSEMEKKHSKSGPVRRKKSSEADPKRRRSGGDRDECHPARRRSEDRRKSTENKRDAAPQSNKRRAREPSSTDPSQPASEIPLLDASSPPPPPPPPPRDTVVIRDHATDHAAPAPVVSNGTGTATTAPLVYVNNNNNNSSHVSVARKRARLDPPSSPLSVAQIMGSPSAMFGGLNDSYAMEQFNDAWDKEADSPTNYQGKSDGKPTSPQSPVPPAQPVDPRSKDRPTPRGNPLQMIMDTIGKDMIDMIGSDDMDIEDDDVPPPPPPSNQVESTTPTDPPPRAKKPSKKASKDTKPPKEARQEVKQEIANIVKLALKVPYKKKKISKEEYKSIMKHVVLKVYESRHVKRGDPLRPDKITEMVAVYIKQSKAQKRKEEESAAA